VRATGRLLHLVSEQAPVSGRRRRPSLPLRNRGAVAPPPLELAIARDEQRQLAARVGAPSMTEQPSRRSFATLLLQASRGHVSRRPGATAFVYGEKSAAGPLATRLGQLWEHRAPTAGTIAFVFLAGTERTSAMATFQSSRSDAVGAAARYRIRPNPSVALRDPGSAGFGARTCIRACAGLLRGVRIAPVSAKNLRTPYLRRGRQVGADDRAGPARCGCGS
jgi:hypothetical protein